MNNAENNIRKFNRFELKYVITLRQAERFKASLPNFMDPDSQGWGGRYTLSSLYYDSPGLRCYHEKENGLRFRRKLRIRHYVTNGPLTEQSPVFIEIKQRVDRVTQKRRVSLPYGDALRLCNDRRMPDFSAEQPFFDEVYAFLWQYNLRPMSIVRYDRQAFTGTAYDPGLRVTFDTSLTFQPNRLRLHEDATTMPILPPNQVVMEIKINERMPYWLTNMIADHNLELMRISKYCRSIEAASNIPALKWRWLPAENSEDVLSSTLSVFSTLRQRMGIQSL
ncbi:MAG: polyphosphate polymerase domain-containing protein [Anaerolineales bacterium]|nr:polyphosphate polymerase domain-containing protein [Anaerolineales bacterium]